MQTEIPSEMADVAKDVVVGVDDDFRVRKSIESLVESAGFAPLVFSSAEAFLQSGKLAEAICLITDVLMPGMDGIELQRRVRLERPKLPIIFITAHHGDAIRRRALGGGAVQFMYKPFDAMDLLTAIQRAVTESSNE